MLTFATVADLLAPCTETDQEIESIFSFPRFPGAVAVQPPFKRSVKCVHWKPNPQHETEIQVPKAFFLALFFVCVLKRRGGEVPGGNVHRTVVRKPRPLHTGQGALTVA